jgi:hypothetical protein
MDKYKNLSTPLGLSTILKDQSSSVSTGDCSYYGRINSTGFGLIRSYEGIPENLVVNLIVTVVREEMTQKDSFLSHISI